MQIVHQCSKTGLQVFLVRGLGGVRESTEHELRGVRQAFRFRYPPGQPGQPIFTIGSLGSSSCATPMGAHALALQSRGSERAHYPDTSCFAFEGSVHLG